jgi:hypothetical protein
MLLAPRPFYSEYEQSRHFHHFRQGKVHKPRSLHIPLHPTAYHLPRLLPFLSLVSFSFVVHTPLETPNLSSSLFPFRSCISSFCSVHTNLSWHTTMSLAPVPAAKFLIGSCVSLYLYPTYTLFVSFVSFVYTPREHAILPLIVYTLKMTSAQRHDTEPLLGSLKAIPAD